MRDLYTTVIPAPEPESRGRGLGSGLRRNDEKQ